MESVMNCINHYVGLSVFGIITTPLEINKVDLYTVHVYKTQPHHNTGDCTGREDAVSFAIRPAEHQPHLGQHDVFDQSEHWCYLVCEPNTDTHAPCSILRLYATHH